VSYSSSNMLAIAANHIRSSYEYCFRGLGARRHDDHDPYLSIRAIVDAVGRKRQLKSVSDYVGVPKTAVHHMN